MTDPNHVFAGIALIVALAGICALAKGLIKGLDTLGGEEEDEL